LVPPSPLCRTSPLVSLCENVPEKVREGGVSLRPPHPPRTAPKPCADLLSSQVGGTPQNASRGHGYSRRGSALPSWLRVRGGTRMRRRRKRGGGASAAGIRDRGPRAAPPRLRGQPFPPAGRGGLSPRRRVPPTYRDARAWGTPEGGSRHATRRRESRAIPTFSLSIAIVLVHSFVRFILFIGYKTCDFPY
jgi:hypothetical protein